MATAICRFTAFATLTEADLGDLASMASGIRNLRRGEFLCHEGDDQVGCYLLIDGWTASSLSLADGSRQIVKVHLPGDMIGLPSLALTKAVDSVTALTAATVSIISRSAIGHLFNSNPRLGALLFLISLEERVSLIDRIVSIGATDAPNRLAALIVHLHSRLLRSDPSTDDRFVFPLSQADVADLIGVTTVHLNRTVQHLRAEQVISWVRQEVTILDRERLIALGSLPFRDLAQDAKWLPGATHRQADTR